MFRLDDLSDRAQTFLRDAGRDLVRAMDSRLSRSSSPTLAEQRDRLQAILADLIAGRPATSPDPSPGDLRLLLDTVMEAGDDARRVVAELGRLEDTLTLHVQARVARRTGADAA